MVFSLTFAATEATVLGILDDVIVYLLQALNLNTEKVDLIIISRVAAGSVVVDGTYSDHNSTP